MRPIGVIGLIAACLIAAGAEAQQNRFPANGLSSNGGGLIIVQMSVPPSPYHTSAMKDKLLLHLSRKANGASIRMEEGAASSDFYSVDSLLASAERSGARYVVTCTVENQKLERRKTFNFPLFFHKYQTIGVIEGEVRILDVKRRKLIVAEPFRSELNGPRIFQGSPEDDINDPDLHINAAAKSTFFAKLEDRAVEQLTETIHRYARGK